MYVPQIPWRPKWFIDQNVLHEQGSRSQGRKLTYEALELGANNLSVILVTCLGFFTSSYVLFTSSNITPMLGFVYWRDATKYTRETAFNDATAAGCVVGTILFGLLADILGRRKMYGFELVTLIVGTMGTVMSSSGYIPLDRANEHDPDLIDYSSFGSMNIYRWLLFWRFVSGCGIGGGYPLDAVMAAEYAPSFKRPRILAMVITTQSFGIATGALVSLVVTKAFQTREGKYDPVHPETSARAVDQIWRWVIGSALLPAVLGVILRFTVPESPRYTIEVLNAPLKASQETRKLKCSDALASDQGVNQEASALPTSDEERSRSSIAKRRQSSTNENPSSLTVKQWFWDSGNWRRLFATSLGWLILDFATFALSLNESSTLSKFWYGPKSPANRRKVWNSNVVDPNASIFSILIDNSVHLLAIKSAAAITSNILLILFITRLNRKMLTWVMFLVTGALLIITGVTLLKTLDTQKSGIVIPLYALCVFAEGFGPGTLTFIIPAEIFPTKWRASCHGISAACGKLGSILASQTFSYITFGKGGDKISESSSYTEWLGYVFIVFGVPKFLAAVFYALWIPDLQDEAGKSKTLEVLALE